jgi:hypothetical protein
VNLAEEAPMTLEMRGVCESCQAPLAPDSEAFICSYECTFCPDCSQRFEGTCPNCGGELLRRPRRLPAGKRLVPVRRARIR